MPNIETSLSGSKTSPPRRSATFSEEPGFYEPAGLWLYGNSRLLGAKLHCILSSFGPDIHSPVQLDEVEREAEQMVLGGSVLVCGIHSSAHQRAAVVPLRWGAPRILVFSGGFHYHLGETLTEEPFRIARLWRYEFDRNTDLVISRRAPEKKPTFATCNPTVDRLITRIVQGEVPGLLFERSRA